eukprot:CAMPEP_0172607724 /NCGR_PEP_ID=MMETSP1068-20121228/27873_1 /TAXON_ID=35684 /ORGANISM="Pseudopedinella elastica, Strain CCMP716" /LENGTH=278 /DNA_ID=CAMNT_0013410801 /DNA_START=333 /DNA_END=1166 /DNA_ORIENTATION=-
MTSCENSNGDRPSEGQTRGSEGANILASLSHTRRPRSALVIGGNTGSDCVGFARFLSGDADVSLHSWVANVERLHAKKGLKFPEAACLGSGKTNTSEYPLLPQASLASVVCVEPLPSNFQVLQRAGRLGWNRIKFINAAVSRHIPPAGTIPFPSEFKFGFEEADMESFKAKRRNPKKPALVLEDIRATTIDELVFNDMNGDPPDILAIDTEGYDFECLQGAERVLATGKVHYIEFEFHKKGPWLHTKLEKAITFLNAYSYECYLAQPALVRLTGCWPW